MSQKTKKNGSPAAPEITNQSPTSRWGRSGRGKKTIVIGFCLLLAVGALGAGLGSKITSVFSSQDSVQKINRAVPGNGSEVSARSPSAPLPTGTPPLSREFVYGGSQLLATDDAAAPQYEADVQNRPIGDGFVDADDVTQIRRFSLGLDLPYQSNEFQRADCSPRGTSGDGYLDNDDIQQARRYSVGTDAAQLAGGPPDPLALLFNDKKQPSKSAFTYASWEQPAESAAQLLPTVLRIPGITGNTGAQMVVPVRVDAGGGEAVFGFSLNYNAAKLSHPVVTIGTAGGDVITNITPDNPNANPVGFSITNFQGGKLGAGANQLLVTVRFDVAPTISAGITDVTFDDVPGTRIARRKVVGVDPLVPLPQAVFTNGVVTIIRQVLAGSN